MPAKAPILYPAQARLLRDLGQRLREARLRRRFTVSQVAERADVSRPTLNKVEQGDPAVTMGTYLRVLTVLGLEKDVSALAGEDPVGRKLQDAALAFPRRAPKQSVRRKNDPPKENISGALRASTDQDESEPA